jgi:hypothetical protein
MSTKAIRITLMEMGPRKVIASCSYFSRISGISFQLLYHHIHLIYLSIEVITLPSGRKGFDFPKVEGIETHSLAQTQSILFYAVISLQRRFRKRRMHLECLLSVARVTYRAQVYMMPVTKKAYIKIYLEPEMDPEQALKEKMQKVVNILLEKHTFESKYCNFFSNELVKVIKIPFDELFLEEVALTRFQNEALALFLIENCLTLDNNHFQFKRAKKENILKTLSQRADKKALPREQCEQILHMLNEPLVRSENFNRLNAGLPTLEPILFDPLDQYNSSGAAATMSRISSLRNTFIESQIKRNASSQYFSHDDHPVEFNIQEFLPERELIRGLESITKETKFSRIEKWNQDWKTPRATELNLNLDFVEEVLQQDVVYPTEENFNLTKDLEALEQHYVFPDFKFDQNADPDCEEAEEDTRMPDYLLRTYAEELPQVEEIVPQRAPIDPYQLIHRKLRHRRARKLMNAVSMLKPVRDSVKDENTPKSAFKLQVPEGVPAPNEARNKPRKSVFFAPDQLIITGEKKLFYGSLKSAGARKPAITVSKRQIQPSMGDETPMRPIQLAEGAMKRLKTSDLQNSEGYSTAQGQLKVYNQRVNAMKSEQMVGRSPEPHSSTLTNTKSKKKQNIKFT